MIKTYCDYCGKEVKKHVEVSYTEKNDWKYLVFCKECFHDKLQILKAIKIK